MTIDPAVVPGLLLLALELLALAAAGFVVVRVALGQTDDRMALAQGLVIGPALWGLIVNFVLRLLPGPAGAIAGWAVILAIGAGLAWRAPHTLRVLPRTLAGFAAATLAVLWIMLAARQTVAIPDEAIHLGLAASIQAGGWPPTISWVPDQPLFYHYGADLLIGLLAPPFGPDLPFTTEVLGAYAWTGFVLVVATLLWRRGGWVSLLTLTPLLLTTGAWTLTTFVVPPDILQIPIPAGVPTAGVRTSLASVYWPEVPRQWQTVFEMSPPNIWTPPFVLAYALAVSVLTWAAGIRSWSLPAALTVAALIGFLGLLSEEVALLTLALWVGLEAVRVLPRPRLASLWRLQESSPAPRRFGETAQAPARAGGLWTLRLRAATGPALAVFLLAVGGSTISALLSGTAVAGFSLGWIEDPASRRPFGTLLTLWPGGVGLLGLGGVPVAAVALLLAWRQRLVLALAAGASVFMLASLILQHRAFQFDVMRMDGHARNFALLALLVALSSRLPAMRPRWRYSASALAVALAVWPSIAVPARTLGLEISHGIDLANAEPGPGRRDPKFESVDGYKYVGRHASEHPVPDPIARYIREHTAVDTRILSPHPHDMTATTGRPNASGFAGLLHLLPGTGGPEYADAIRYLEPAAVRRLGFAYLHATDAWIVSLPDRAQRWLNDPRLFEPIIHGGADALYRIQPAFLRLDPMPAPQSFEALRQAVPASAAVYLPEALPSLDRVRLASVLAHTQLLGEVDFPPQIYLLTDIPTKPLGTRFPDVVIVPQGSASFFNASIQEFAPIWKNPLEIWRSHGLFAYVASPTIAPAIDPSPQPETETAFVVRVSAVHPTADTITFAATFSDYAPEQWTGQDWLVIPLDDTPWALPTKVKYDRYTLLGGAQWYAGQIIPGQGSTTHVFEFDPRAARLKVKSPDGGFAASTSSGPRLEPGVWALAVRLRQNYLQAAVIPVLKVVISETEGVSYTVFAGELSSSVNPCPESLNHTDSCRQLVANTTAPISP